MESILHALLSVSLCWQGAVCMSWISTAACIDINNDTILSRIQAFNKSYSPRLSLCSSGSVNCVCAASVSVTLSPNMDACGVAHCVCLPVPLAVQPGWAQFCQAQPSSPWQPRSPEWERCSSRCSDYRSQCGVCGKLKWNPCKLLVGGILPPSASLPCLQFLWSWIVNECLQMPPAERVNLLRRAGWPQLCSPPRSWLATSCGWTCPCALTTWRSRKRSRSSRRRGGDCPRKRPCWRRLSSARMDQDEERDCHSEKRSRATTPQHLQKLSKGKTCSQMLRTTVHKAVPRCFLQHFLLSAEPFCAHGFCSLLNSDHQCRRLCLFSVWRAIESAEVLHSAIMNEERSTWHHHHLCVNVVPPLFPRALPLPEHIFHSTKMRLIFEP